MRRFSTAIPTVVLVVGCSVSSVPPRPEANVASSQRSDCTSCHLQRALEFEQSRMHYGAGTKTFKSFVDLAARDLGEEFAASCTTECHAVAAPGVAAAPNGMSCEVCHLAVDVAGRPPNARLVWGDARVITGPPSVGNPRHEYAERSVFETADLCAPCHAGPHGSTNDRPSSTYGSWARTTLKERVDCVACHMENGNHAFVGAHNRVWVREAVSVDFELADAGSRLTVTNGAAGHDVPSDATDLRAIEIWVTWTNAEGGAVTRSRVATFGACHRDAKGRVVPYWRSTHRDCNQLVYGRPHVIPLVPPSFATGLRAETIFHRVTPEVTWLFADPMAIDSRTETLRIDNFSLRPVADELIGELD